MTFLASLLAAATLFLPLFAPDLAFEGARPLALAALPWLALAPLARGGALHVAFGAPVLGLGFGLEWAQGAEGFDLALLGATLLAWGAILPGALRSDREREAPRGSGVFALVWAGAAACAALPALVVGDVQEPGGIALAASYHPLVLVWKAAAGGASESLPGPAQLATASAVVLGLALIHARLRSRALANGEEGPA